MDAFILKKASVDMERQRIQTAVKMIQRHPRFRDVPVIHIPENAPGSAGPHLHEHLRGFRNVMTMEECGKGEDSKLGVPATDRNEQTYQMSMMLSTQAMHYSANCMTFPGQDLSKIKDKFEFQLLCWERVVEYDPSKPLAKVREKWTAKHAAGNDDLAICGLMLMEWPMRFFQNPKYSDFVRCFISHQQQQQRGVGNNGILAVGMPKGPASKGAQLASSAYSRARQRTVETIQSTGHKTAGGGGTQPYMVAGPSYKPHSNITGSLKRTAAASTTIPSTALHGAGGRPLKLPKTSTVLS